MNASEYSLKAISDIKEANLPREPGLDDGLNKTTFEFEAVVEAGPKGSLHTKVFVFGKPSEAFRNKVHGSVVKKEEFSLWLEPQSNETFVAVLPQV